MNKESNVKSVMIVGVGGQGTLLASRILGNVAVSGGYDVKLSEVHGMAQRGGSVVTYVKYGKKVYSPVIVEGSADVILSFEELEALRYLPYLKEGGTLIVNTQQIDPMPVITGAASYPQDIVSQLREKSIHVIAVDALSLAHEAGNIKAVNVVLLGVMAQTSEIGKEAWLRALEATVPARFLDVNRKAFALGYGVK